MIRFCKKCQSETERRKNGGCQPCAAAYRLMNAERIRASSAAYRDSNREKVRAASTKYRLENPEKVKAAQAAYEEKNRDKINASKAKWRRSNPKKCAEQAAKWRAANHEKAKAAGRRCYAANREKINARAAEWRKENAACWVKQRKALWRAENPESNRLYMQKRRVRKLSSGGALSKGIVGRLLKLQRGLCPCCKRPLGNEYHMDHIMPLALGGEHVDSNIQLLRASCNLRKQAKHPVDFMQQRGFLL